jgi:hypothetical protein
VFLPQPTEQLLQVISKPGLALEAIDVFRQILKDYKACPGFELQAFYRANRGNAAVDRK